MIVGGLKHCAEMGTCRMGDLMVEEKMDIVFVGHVDHGKSTVIGRLLADTDSLPDGKLELVQNTCKQNNEPFEYAYLIDALKDERAQSITIDSARVFFQSDKRHYIIIDAPGHIEFIKNMVTGAARAEAAVLVIDANEGVMENSRRHGYLLGMLGIKQVLILINKMDIAGFDQKVFENIKKEYLKFLTDINIEPMDFIPVSGKFGDNLTSPSKLTSWYKGKTLLESLDRFEKISSDKNTPFRMPVQDIYKFSNYGDNRRILVGTPTSGRLNIGDEIVFYPSGKHNNIKTFESYKSTSPESILTGQASGFTLKDQIFVKRGEVVCKANERAPMISTKIRASVFWLGNNPLSINKSYIIKLGTSRVEGQIGEIHRVTDADSLRASEKKRISRHEIAEVTINFKIPIVFELSETHNDLSRFVILDEQQIWGGGIILEAIQDDDEKLREGVFTRNSQWIRSQVTYKDRVERNNQHSSLLLITGQQNSGRKKLASMLETKLFLEGKQIYYLGVGSILYGLNADIKRDDAVEWKEHIRRISELAYIFMDSGTILVMTAVELTQEDLHVIDSIVEPKKVKVAWVGDDVTTDIEFDLHVNVNMNFENSVVKIKELLMDQGAIFKL